ncbi:uncharacterized protein LOC141850861 [Brevipalpus obovatus]|uniref:uncharacterized protein LOC141850861 n=1 Tax=Brevipalpus obovatus TaxID=246614 RepID=UPI003D9EEF25
MMQSITRVSARQCIGDEICLILKHHRTKVTYITPRHVLKQQGRMMDRLDGRFQKTYVKMLNPKGPREHRATPYTSILEGEEGVGNIIKRRQNVLNRIFLHHITEILANNDMAADFRKTEAIITQVEVSKNYSGLRVYFYCPQHMIKTVTRELNIIKGPLNELLIQLKIMGKVPPIELVYDNASKVQDIVLKKLETADFGPDHIKKDPHEYIPPQKVTPNPPRIWVTRHIWSLTTFKSDRTDNPYTEKKPSPYPEFSYPKDMRLDAFRLDYSVMMHKILFNLRKSRNATGAFQASADPLPPVDWSTYRPMPPPLQDPKDPALQYEKRIDLMKKFVVESQRKKLILAREAKKLKYEHDHEVADRLAWVKSKTLGGESDSTIDSSLDNKDEAAEFYNELDSSSNGIGNSS